MKRVITSLLLSLAAAQANAALIWLPSASDATGGAEYTIKRVWEYSDGSNIILQVEVNESIPNQGCTNARPNTLFAYSNPFSSWQQQLANKLTVAQLNGSPIKAVINTGTANWCHNYGLGLWGLEVIVR